MAIVLSPDEEPKFDLRVLPNRVFIVRNKAVVILHSGRQE